MSPLKLSCQCGKVKGVATDITPDTGNHVVCCCCDCQSFAQHLNKSHETLDDFGGTQIYQTSQSQVEITQGAEYLTCLRLTPKGITRWYTSCCNTPVGNTLNAKMPFVGIIHNFIEADADTAEKLGPIRAYVQTQYATKPPTYPHHHAKFPLGITLRIMFKIVLWKLRGMGQPSVFYNAEFRPTAKPIIVSNLDN